MSQRPGASMRNPQAPGAGEEIVRVRRDISTELRRFLTGDAADRARVVTLWRRYGELDGYTCRGAYLYSEPIAWPEVGNTDFLFSAGRRLPVYFALA